MLTLKETRRRNLERLLRPRSIAIIGASGDPARIGGRPVRYLRESWFEGQIFPVNPNRDEVQGLRCYPSLDAVDEPVDAAIIALPANLAVSALEECAERGIAGCVLFAGDFAEAGAEGAARQERIAEIANQTGLRVLGPNCLGLFDAKAGAYLTFSSFFDRGVSPDGQTALISQSGGFGSHLLEVVKARGTKIASWITTGNEVDVELGECLEWAAEQDHINTILAYTEGVKDGESLRRGLERAAEAAKPVIIMKAGRSQRGAAAAATHTAALAGSDTMYDGIFQQFGVRRVYSAEEMADVAYLLGGRPIPASRSAALFTVSGAGGVQMADTAEDVGLNVPTLPEPVQNRIKELARFAAPANPIDFTAQALNDPQILPGCLRAVTDHTDIGAIVIYLTMTADDPGLREQIFEQLSLIAQEYPERVFVLCMLGSGQLVERYEAAGFRVFEDSARAVRALGFALTGRKVLANVGASAPISTAVLEGAAHSEHLGKKLLSDLGIAVPKGFVGETPAEMAAASRDLHFPVVAKILSDRILHKTDIGGVKLGLGSPEEVEVACADIVANVQKHLPDLAGIELLIEEQLPKAVELILGVENDAALGPMVMVGMGGVQAEVYKDAAFRMAPVSEEEALRMLASLSGAALFETFRGRAELDIQGVAKAVAALSRFAAAHAEKLQSVDVNPLLVNPAGAETIPSVAAADCVIVLKENGKKISK